MVWKKNRLNAGIHLCRTCPIRCWCAVFGLHKKRNVIFSMGDTSLKNVRRGVMVIFEYEKKNFGSTGVHIFRIFSSTYYY